MILWFRQKIQFYGFGGKNQFCGFGGKIRFNGFDGKTRFFSFGGKLDFMILVKLVIKFDLLKIKHIILYVYMGNWC